jgi:hypothetical protein
MASNTSLTHLPYGLNTGLTDIQTLLPGTTTGIVTAITITSGGVGYAASDTGIIVGGSLNAQYKVATVTSGVVATITLVYGGNGYATGAGQKTQATGIQKGSGTGLTVNIGTVVTGDLLTSLLANGLYEPTGTYIITKGSADNIRINAPGIGPSKQDGRRIIIISSTAFAHTLTGPTNVFNGNTHIATASGTLPNSIELEAYNGVWYTIGTPVGWTLS